MNYNSQKNKLKEAASDAIGFSDSSKWEEPFYKGFLAGCKYMFKEYEVKKKENKR